MSQLVIRTSIPTPLRAYLSPLPLVATLARHRGLIGQFTSREIVERHRGAYLGAAWNVINPLISLAIYTFVFGYVFKSRWQEASDGIGGQAIGGAFVLPFFLGHALFHFFSECVNRAPGLVASRPNLVKKVVFPVEILPVVGLLSSLVYPAVAVGCLLLVQMLLVGSVPPTALLLPLVVAPLVPLCMGISWVLATMGVYIRDVRQITVVLTQLAMFLTPVFYPVDRIPEQWRGVYMLNPVTIVIENARSVMLWGTWPNWLALGGVMLFGLLVMQLGYAVFMRTRQGLSDVI